MLMFHRGVGKNGFAELQVQKDLNRSDEHTTAQTCEGMQCGAGGDGGSGVEGEVGGNPDTAALSPQDVSEPHHTQEDRVHTLDTCMEREKKKPMKMCRRHQGKHGFKEYKPDTAKETPPAPQKGEGEVVFKCGEATASDIPPKK